MAGRQRRHPPAALPQDIDGILVRVDVAEGHWAEDIPPVPTGSTVTVSFGSEGLAAEHRDALELIGYDVVDAPFAAHGSASGNADFLVTIDVLERHPTYWRSLADHATRAYHLALGPAALVVADVVAAHAPVLARGGTR